MHTQKELSQRQTAKMLGISPITLRRYGSIGAIKFRKNPYTGYKFFSLEEIKRFAKQVYNKDIA